MMFRSPDHRAAAEQRLSAGCASAGSSAIALIGHWLAHGFCNLSMSHESREGTGFGLTSPPTIARPTFRYDARPVPGSTS